MPQLWNDTWGFYWDGNKLNTNALITENELMPAMRLDRNSLQKPFLQIYNSSADATAATVSKVGKILTLTVTGGTNASVNVLSVINGDVDTIDKLINQIHAYNRGWVCNLICSSDQLSVNLYNTSISCLSSTNNTTLSGFDGLYLDELINSASQVIEKICHHVLVSADYTEYYDGSDSMYLRLRQYPVSTFTSLKAWDYQAQKTIQDYTNNTDYEVYLDSGIICKSGYFSTGIKNYQVIYTAGYTTIPSDLKQACKNLCQYLDNSASRSGIKSESIGRYSVTFSDIGGVTVMGVYVPPEIMTMLQPYMKLDSESIGK